MVDQAIIDNLEGSGNKTIEILMIFLHIRVDTDDTNNRWIDPWTNTAQIHTK